MLCLGQILFFGWRSVKTRGKGLRCESQDLGKILGKLNSGSHWTLAGRWMVSYGQGAGGAPFPLPGYPSAA